MNQELTNIRDYGFAAYLVMQGITYIIKDGLTYFTLSNGSRDTYLKKYRQSSFREFDNIKRQLNQKINPK